MSVAPGSYPEAMWIATNHSGTAALLNRLAGSGAAADAVTIIGAVIVTNCQYVSLENLSVISNSVTVQNYSPNCIISNCIVRGAATGIFVGHFDGLPNADNTLITHSLILDNSGDGIYTRNYVSPRINHCAIYGNGRSGVWQGMGVPIVRNSIIAGNGGYGLLDTRSESYYYVAAAYNVIFGNGTAEYYRSEPTGASEYNTAAEINSIPGCSNNIVQNPGFAALANNWDFSTLYADSPCRNAAEDGTAIGAYPAPSTLAVSANTYYVAKGGDDSRSPATATNPATPWASITNAAANARAGDTVLVSAGEYAGQVTVTRGASGLTGVVYRATGGVTNAGDASGGYGFFLNRVSGVTVDGFALTRFATNGVHMAYGMFHRVVNVVAFSNASCGIALHRSQRTVLEGMNIYSNKSHGIYVMDGSGGTWIDRCRTWKNANGVTVDKTSAMRNIRRMSNSDIAYNTGLGINCGGGNTMMLENCTLVGNGSSGFYFGANPAVYQVRNCVVAYNAVNGLYSGHSQGTFMISNTCFYSNTACNYYTAIPVAYYNTAAEINAQPYCSNNIVADPGFRDRTAGVRDFRFSVKSPCVNAGTKTTDMALDLYGGNRLVGPAVDMGSYEDPTPCGMVISIY